MCIPVTRCESLSDESENLNRELSLMRKFPDLRYTSDSKDCPGEVIQLRIVCENDPQ